MARECRGKYNPRFQGAAVHPKTAVKLPSRLSSSSLLQKEHRGERKNRLLHSLLPRAALHDQKHSQLARQECGAAGDCDSSATLTGMVCREEGGEHLS